MEEGEKRLFQVIMAHRSARIQTHMDKQVQFFKTKKKKWQTGMRPQLSDGTHLPVLHKALDWIPECQKNSYVKKTSPLGLPTPLVAGHTVRVQVKGLFQQPASMISPISGPSQVLPSIPHLLASSKVILCSKASCLLIWASSWSCYRCSRDTVQGLWFPRVAALWPLRLWHSSVEENWRRPSHQHSSFGSLTEEPGGFWVSQYCPADRGLWEIRVTPLLEYIDRT